MRKGLQLRLGEALWYIAGAFISVVEEVDHFLFFDQTEKRHDDQ